MASITFTIPDEVKSDMKKLSWINWSELAREAAIKKLERYEALEILNSIVAKSKLTEKDAIEIGRKIKKSMHERYKQKYKEAY